jgi:hypothetical protein
MNPETELILNIEPLKEEAYAKISSKEKLVVYALLYLDQNGISSSFNNLCVASFKLFPKAFQFSEEFTQYPHLEMLNRTILHLRPKERNYATGNTKTFYKLTELGTEIAKQVKYDLNSDLNNTKEVKLKKVDKHKPSSEKLYNKILSEPEFLYFLNTNEIDELYVWKLFEVTPFSNEREIRINLKLVRILANEKNNDEIVQFIDSILSKL